MLKEKWFKELRQQMLNKQLKYMTLTPTSEICAMTEEQDNCKEDPRTVWWCLVEDRDDLERVTLKLVSISMCIRWKIEFSMSYLIWQGSTGRQID